MTLFEVVQRIAPELEHSPLINALWIEGSWATGQHHDKSDIDVWMDVQDGAFTEAIGMFRKTLKGVGEIDWEESRGVYSNNPKLEKRTFHLKDFPLEQRIELDLQEHSRKFIFDKTEHVIKVMFDKNRTIKWQ